MWKSGVIFEELEENLGFALTFANVAVFQTDDVLYLLF